ncbi:MAG: YncE family protein [Gemmatimonadetes bacterium]|nr:YncE family protein [Gemmatimonadota bacterium]
MSRRLVRSIAALAAVATLLSTTRAGAQDAGGYKVTHKIPVGGEGGWDYITVAGGRLYVSHATKLVVLDLRTERVVGEVPNTNGIHGAAIALDLGKGFTSNGRDTTVTIFDLYTLETLGTVHTTGANPDAIFYDAVTRRVFTFNGRGENATAIDAVTGAVLGTIPLKGKPEFAQSNGHGLIYVNIETDPGQIAVIDTKAIKEVKRYPLPGCKEPSGLAYDGATDRLFSVCDEATMVVSDPKTGKVVAKAKIGDGVDAVSFDPALKLVFASNGGDGTMTVIRQDGANAYTVLGNVTTQKGSRTMTIDPVTHKAYMVGVEFGEAPAAQPGQRAGRPPIVPGSFSILVLEK